MARSFYLFKRGKIYYAEILDESGRRVAVRSTHKKTELDAAIEVGGWLKTGIPERRRSPRTTAELLDARRILASLKTAELTPQEAEAAARILIDRGLLDGTFSAHGPGSRTLKDFLSEFWDHEKSPFLKERAAMKKPITKRHALEMTRRAALYWFPALGEKALNQITRDDVKSLALDLIERPRTGPKDTALPPLTPGSVNKILTAGTTALAWAAREGIISNNPAEKVGKIGGQAAARGVLEPDEVGKVFAAPWKERRARVANLLCMSTGIRLGEALAVRKSDVAETVLHVRHSWSPIDRLKCPKNGQARRVPLLPEIRRELLALIEENPHKDADPFAFYSAKPGQPMDFHYASDGLRDACTAAGIDAKARGIVVHSWRHFYTSRLAAAVDLKKVSLVTGHRSQEIAAHYASHADAAAFSEVSKATEETLGKIMNFSKAN